MAAQARGGTVTWFCTAGQEGGILLTGPRSEAAMVRPECGGRYIQEALCRE